MKKREETPVEYTWRMEDMLPSDKAWEELYEETKREAEKYGDWKGRLSESEDALKECLVFDDEISRKTELLFVYARQKSDEDTGNQRYQDYTARASLLSNKVSELSAYIVPEILAMDRELLERYMESGNGIGHFKRAVDMILAKKQHTLPAEMEELLAGSHEIAQTPSQIFSMFNNADIRFPVIEDWNGQDVTITHGNFIALMESRDRRVRRDAFQGLYSAYRQYKNTLAATFAANVKQAVFYARARRYPSSRAYYLAENEIPESVYDNLVTSVRGGLSYMHDYVKLRKKVLHLDEIHMYDIYTPMVQAEEKRYSFETAKEMVLEGLAPLGEEYLSILREGFENRWIDVYENEGKRSGAYSWGAYGSHPYVLLNYNGTLDSVFTLAHEMGHSIHSYYSDKNQPYTYAGYKIFVAEVASTCNEALLIRSLLEKTDDRGERAFLINHFLDTFKGTLFRQTMFAEFEMEAHKKAEEGRSLTADMLCGMYRRLNVDYYGDEMTVDGDIDYEWSRIPHFYTPFYVYQYATGFSAAIAISNKILSGDQKALLGYREFLSGGCSMPPIELLKLSGVDMSRPEPVSEALEVFCGLLSELESLL